MTRNDSSHLITDISALEELYGAPSKPATIKELDYIHPAYRKLIEHSPFAVLATASDDGLDASPRGDKAGFVVVEDEKTLLLPDRRGNNRVDSLRNIIANPHVALFFLIPGIGETMRVNGRASISVDPALLDRFIVNGKPPRSVIVISVDAAFFQCSKAVVRSDLWNAQTHIERSALPSTGAILGEISKDGFDGAAYDRELPERLRETLY